MEYTVQKLSRMAGISARTLRYDEIGLKANQLVGISHSSLPP